MDSEWVRLIVSVLSGLAATIPLVIQLVKYVRKTIQDKNWPEVVKLVTSYMERAETMFEKGADRKEWVMAMVKASADTVNYDLDMDKIYLDRGNLNKGHKQKERSAAPFQDLSHVHVMSLQSAYRTVLEVPLTILLISHRLSIRSEILSISRS